MATVYHARFETTGGVTKQVALKLIHPHLSREPDFVRMFITEMRVAMEMSHRNVVQTFDAGKSGDRYYMVMELMNRGSLSGLSSVPLDIAVLVAMEVCAGLAYAHSFRKEPVIHRDVSPSNILLSDQGDVKLADFGVAKVAGQLSRTATGMVKGKLRYMPPEQARGEVDPRSDLFALGAVLYWMVTGEPLRPNPSIDQVRLGDRVEFPVERAKQIPLSLQVLIGRCLRRDPERRPVSAAELRELLARELAPIQHTLGTEGDPLARLRDFFAVGAPTVAVQDPRRQPERVAEAVLQVALAVPTHHGQQVGPGEASTPPLAEATTMRLEKGGTAETSVSPTLQRQRADHGKAAPPPLAEAETMQLDDGDAAETSVSPTLQRPPPQLAHGPLLGLGLIAAALFIVGVIVWAVWPRAPVDQIAAHPGDAAVVPDSSAASNLADATAREPDTSAPEPDARAPEPAARRGAPVVDRPRPRRTPRGYGRLDLNSSPFAKVYVDGRLVGETPLQGIRLRAGQHVVKLVDHPRKLSATLTVHVRAGRTTRRWVRLGTSQSK